MKKLNFMLWTLVLAATAAAADKTKAKDEISAEARLALRAVSERYRNLPYWKAEFNQEQISMSLGSKEQSFGRFVFAQPSKFLFTLDGPGALGSDFISNGREAWYVKYKNGRKSAPTIEHFAKASELELERYLLLLKGFDATSAKREAAILKQFKISTKVDPTQLSLTLEPKGDSELARIEMIFMQNSEFPSNLILTDALGNHTEIKILKAEKLDKEPAPATFAPSKEALKK